MNLIKGHSINLEKPSKNMLTILNLKAIHASFIMLIGTDRTQKILKQKKSQCKIYIIYIEKKSHEG